MYKVSPNFIKLYSAKAIKIDEIDTKMVMNWTEPKGEIIIIQRPSKSLMVEVTTDNEIYSPGDAVNY
jgi:hypothetical protein